MSKYTDQFKDPRWQKKRLKIMERDNYTCCICRNNKKPLNVHHGYYEKGKKAWEYEDKSLWTLCEDCHKETHEKLSSIYKLLGCGS